MADLHDNVVDGSGDSDTNHAENGDETPPRKRVCLHYKTKWQATWSKKFPCIERVNDYQAKCTVFAEISVHNTWANEILCVIWMAKTTKGG